jgi:tRNA U34 5-carboxymethylaminomethyl modifying enzyme MnmG/GidA
VGLGFETGRLKTGTPARVDSRTVNFSVLEPQPGGCVSGQVAGRGWVWAWGHEARSCAQTH